MTAKEQPTDTDRPRVCGCCGDGGQPLGLVTVTTNDGHPLHLCYGCCDNCDPDSDCRWVDKDYASFAIEENRGAGFEW